MSEKILVDLAFGWIMALHVQTAIKEETKWLFQYELLICFAYSTHLARKFPWVLFYIFFFSLPSFTVQPAQFTAIESSIKSQSALLLNQKALLHLHGTILKSFTIFIFFFLKEQKSSLFVRVLCRFMVAIGSQGRDMRGFSTLYCYLICMNGPRQHNKLD